MVVGHGDPNFISWGTMIGSPCDVLRTAPYLAAIPGLAILLTVLAPSFVGDGKTARSIKKAGSGGR